MRSEHVEYGSPDKAKRLRGFVKMTVRIIRAETSFSVAKVLAALSPKWKMWQPLWRNWLNLPRQDVLVLKNNIGQKAHITLQDDGQVQLQKWAMDRCDEGGWYIPCGYEGEILDISVPDSLAGDVADSNPPVIKVQPDHEEECDVCYDLGFSPYLCNACGMS